MQRALVGAATAEPEAERSGDTKFGCETNDGAASVSPGAAVKPQHGGGGDEDAPMFDCFSEAPKVVAVKELLADLVGDATADADYELLVDKCLVHICSAYCRCHQSVGRAPKKNSDAATAPEKSTGAATGTVAKAKGNKLYKAWCREMFGDISEGETQAVGKPPRQRPALVLEHERVRLEMERDHPKLVQNARIIVQSWRANVDSALVIDRNADRITSYITSHMYKGTATTKELVGEWKRICKSAPPGGSVRSLAAKLTPAPLRTRWRLRWRTIHRVVPCIGYRRRSRTSGSPALSKWTPVVQRSRNSTGSSAWRGATKTRFKPSQATRQRTSNTSPTFTGCWSIPNGRPCEKYAKFVLVVFLPGSWSSDYDPLLWEPTYSEAVEWWLHATDDARSPPRQPIQRLGLFFQVPRRRDSASLVVGDRARQPRGH